MDDTTRRIVLASRNKGKIVELERLLAQMSHDSGSAISVLGLADFPDFPDVEETGSSFEENALLKATAICEYTGIPALADDSGLCVDALDGAPGIFSARYAGRHGDDEANNAKLLRELREKSSRNARFVSCVALVLPATHPSGALVVMRRGEVHGEIAPSPRGSGGFGYDPLFFPRINGQLSQRTMAELSPEEKDAISHRGEALRQIVPEIEELI
jgi:XTP/dITP diphosphohydrolase